MKKRMINTIYEYLCFITKDKLACLSTFSRLFGYSWGIALLFLHKYLLSIIFIVCQLLCSAMIISAFIRNQNYHVTEKFIDNYSFDFNNENRFSREDIPKKNRIRAIKTLIKLNEQMNKDLLEELKKLEEEDK